MKETEHSAWANLPIDGEIVITRVIDADRETVFDAWVFPLIVNNAAAAVAATRHDRFWRRRVRPSNA